MHVKHGKRLCLPAFPCRNIFFYSVGKNYMHSDYALLSVNLHKTATWYQIQRLKPYDAQYRQRVKER